MSLNIIMSEKKKALIAYKQKIFTELKYYDARIEEISSNRSKTSFFEDTDSSDSETEFPLSVDLGPSATELKLQQSTLRICMQATQELTNLQVLQSEVNVLVDDPVFEGEPPVLEPGLWREVTAECRVDLVPFSISFCVHQPSRQFPPRRFRALQVTAVKAAHAAELAKSILPAITNPSDAVEVLKSYSSAHRSRRSTLARLADKFPNLLFMEPMSDGGYLLKCANLLEVSWTLQNKWSPIAPFHHRMKFDLEYMDESYIKIITQTHRQLSDPSVETDERTFLLSKIISTCLEAQGPTAELYESMSSDPETESLRKRRTTLDQEPEAPAVKKNKDREVMAPPKSLPKKAKPKGKENVVDNRKSKRMDEVGDSKVKRVKTSNIPGGKEPKFSEDMIGNDLDADKDMEGNVKSVAIEKNYEGKESVVNEVGNKNSKPISNKKIGKASVAIDKNSKAVKESDAVKVVSKNTKPVPSKNKVNKTNNVATEKNNDAVKDNVTDEVGSNNTKPNSNKDKVGKANSVATEKESEVAKESDVVKVVTKNTKSIPNKNKVSKASNVGTEKDNESVKKKDTVKDLNKNTKPTPKTGKISKDDNVTTEKNNAATSVKKCNASEVVNKKNEPNLNKDKVAKAKTIATDKNEAKSVKASDAPEVVKKIHKPISNKDKVDKAKTIATEKENVAKSLKESNTAKDSNKKTKPKPNKDTNKDKNNVANAKKILQRQDDGQSEEKKVNKDNTDKIAESVSAKTNGDKLESDRNADKKQLKTKINSKVTSVQNKETANPDREITSKESTQKEKPKNDDVSKNTYVPVNSNKLGKNKSVKAKVKPLATTNKPNTKIEQSKKNNNQQQNEKVLPTKTVKSKPVTNKENNNNKNTINDNTENTVEKVTEQSKSVASKRKSNLAEIEQEVEKNVTAPKKQKLTKPEAVSQKNDKYFDKLKDNKIKQTKVNKLQNKETIGKIVKQSELNRPKITSGTVKSLKTGNVHRVLSAGNISRHSSEKISRIPQKKMSAASEATLKKNPLRISPRKAQSKFKTTKVFGTRQTLIQKTTSIPRLLKKPSPKT